MNNKEIYTFGIPKIISQFNPTTTTIEQCDACSAAVSTKHKRPQFNLSHMSYCASPTLVKQTVDSIHYALLSPSTNTLSVLNEEAIMFLQHFNSPNTPKNIPSIWSETWSKSIVQSTLEQMIRLGLLVPKDYITQQTKTCHPFKLTEVPTMLAAWLHITDRCNLRCAYCYLPHYDVDMSFETGRAVIEGTFRSAVAHNYRKVKFKYGGGEPLLRFLFIAELHRYARKLADQHNLTLDGVVLSNGTLLTKEIVREIQTLGLRLMISLDNLGEEAQPRRLQYGQRIYLDGRDVSHDAMRAIELALECGLVPNISITVSGANVENLPELLAWLLERDLPFNLNFYREHKVSSKLETRNSKLETRRRKDYHRNARSL